MWKIPESKAVIHCLMLKQQGTMCMAVVRKTIWSSDMVASLSIHCGFPQCQDPLGTHLTICIPIIKWLQPIVYYRTSLKTFPKYNWEANSWGKGLYSKVLVYVVCSQWARFSFIFSQFLFYLLFDCFIYVCNVFWSFSSSISLSYSPTEVGTDIHPVPGLALEC